MARAQPTLPLCVACTFALAVTALLLGGQYPASVHGRGSLGAESPPKAVQRHRPLDHTPKPRGSPPRGHLAPTGPAQRDAAPLRRAARGGIERMPLFVAPAEAAPPVTPSDAGQAPAALPSPAQPRHSTSTDPGVESSGDDGARYSIGARLAAGGCVYPPAFARANATVVVLRRGPRTGVGTAGWTGMDRQVPHFVPWAGFTVDSPPCTVPCTVTRDQRALATADAVLFEPPSYAVSLGAGWQAAKGLEGMETPAQKPRGQLWGAMHYETSREFSELADAAVVSQVDFWTTYREDAEVPVSLTCPWGDGADERVFLQQPPAKSRDHLAVYVASRCNGHASAREAYVAELMRHMPVHSYGACHHNRELPPELAKSFHRWPRRYDLKMALFRRYMFVLAFENANATDYVTEKLPHALQGLAVPVYMGTRAVEQWAPGSHSYIHVSDFASPRHLAAYLLWLRDHPREYSRYFEWKSRPLRPQFRDKLRRCILTDGACRVCRFVREARCGARANDTRQALPDV